MSNYITKRSEILFCYDIKDANPNGDPLDSNKPRIDEELSINIVTDVRLKKTVREYLEKYEGYNGTNDKDNLLKETESNKGGIKDAKARATDFFSEEEEVLSNCIDIRLFGGVIPLPKSSITFTGPIQFQMGRSMHRVEMKYIKGTGAFASSEGKSQNTFREEYILPYSFINFHGVVNENAAKDTKLTEEDVLLLTKGLWNGTKNLITRSKFGQMPRLLIKVNYKEDNYFIGDINKMIKLVSTKRDELIRDVEDFSLDISDLKNVLSMNKSKIESIEYLVDSRLKFISNDKEAEITDLFDGTMIQLGW